MKLKTNNFFYKKVREKKLEIKTIINIKKIIYDKLGLKDEIETIKTFIKGPITKKKQR